MSVPGRHRLEDGTHEGGWSFVGSSGGGSFSIRNGACKLSLLASSGQCHKLFESAGASGATTIEGTLIQCTLVCSTAGRAICTICAKPGFNQSVVEDCCRMYRSPLLVTARFVFIYPSPRFSARATMEDPAPCVMNNEVPCSVSCLTSRRDSETS